MYTEEALQVQAVDSKTYFLLQVTQEVVSLLQMRHVTCVVGEKMLLIANHKLSQVDSTHSKLYILLQQIVYTYKIYDQSVRCNA